MKKNCLTSNRVFCLILLLLLIIIVNFKGSVSTQESADDVLKVSSSVAHDPIAIDGNDDFHAQAEQEGWDLGGSRDGTSSKPYVIAGYNVNRISIKNTRVFFQISNNSIDGLNGGTINFFNVKHGTIINNTINNAGTGIYLEQFSCQNIISNNTINNGEVGIRCFEFSDNNTLSSNTITNNEYGIVLVYVKNTLVSNNNLLYNSKNGIILLNEAANNIISFNNINYNGEDGINLEEGHNYISNNTITNNGGNGIYSEYLNHNTVIQSNNVSHNADDGIRSKGNNSIITNNFIYNNSENGLSVDGCYHSIISHNNISQNGDNSIFVSGLSSQNLFSDNYIYNSGIGINLHYQNDNNTIVDNIFLMNYRGIGIYGNNNLIYGNSISQTRANYSISVRGCNNIVCNNNFTENNPGGDSQATTSICHGGVQNYFDHNYWDDWTSPDDDSDGIVDIPYSINSGVKNVADHKDLHPLVNPVPRHTLSAPIITFPNGGEILSGKITIQWIAPSDSWEDQITYSVYYSSNGGKNWIKLASNLHSVHYNWDTSTFSPGSNFKVRIVSYCFFGLSTEDISNDGFSIEETVDFSTKSEPEGIQTTGWTVPILLITFLTIIPVIRMNRRE